MTKQSEPEQVQEPDFDAASSSAPPKSELDESDAAQIQPEGKNRSAHILDLALTIFHNTRMLHGLGSEDQDILEQALRLQVSRLPRTKKKPLQSLLDFVRSLPKLDLSDAGQLRLAAVLGSQCGLLRTKEFSRLELSPAQRRDALTIAAILDIAGGLDHSASGATKIIKVEPSHDGMWIVISGPDAAADAALARRKTRLWVEIGYPNVEILLPEEAALRSLPFPEPLEKIGILPGDPLSEAGRKVMRFHFAQMLLHEPGTRQGEDIEALHDMRVATRRLRAAFEVFEQAFEPAALKPLLKRLRKTGHLLGAVRDLDVFMEKAQKYIDNLPEARQSGLSLLLNDWGVQRDSARLLMIEYLDSPEYLRFKHDFNLFLNTPLAGARTSPDDPTAPNLVRHLAPILIYQRMASVRAYEAIVHDAPIERLHMLRIEFKKFRYTVEYFREVLGKRAFDIIEAVKTLQDHLGDMNDAQVASQILREFIDHWESSANEIPGHERESIAEVANYLAARLAERRQLFSDFPIAWETHYHNRTFRRQLSQAVSVL